MNEQIRLSPILLIDENNNRVGEVATHEALSRARELGMDLVEIAPDARPIVCKIMDYGKHKYEQSKKDKANRARSKTSELKEVRLGRSMKIDPHDVAIRMKKAREFLMDGHKVQIVQNFRGREMMHKEKGYERMKKIIADLEDISKIEVPPRLSGRRMTLMLGPDKTRIDKIKRQLAKEAAKANPQPTESKNSKKKPDSKKAPKAQEPPEPPESPAPAPAPAPEAPVTGTQAPETPEAIEASTS